MGYPVAMTLQKMKHQTTNLHRLSQDPVAYPAQMKRQVSILPLNRVHYKGECYQMQFLVQRHLHRKIQS
ncbi:hypothetical protein O3P69_010098 [Scylla paramamosain]|uniref:Uncharacterized protein n=1 Tax=Scylla paramamosain TaxID=85552 RepID=A0AAW0SPL9_SCYPA